MKKMSTPMKINNHQADAHFQIQRRQVLLNIAGLLGLSISAESVALIDCARQSGSTSHVLSDTLLAITAALAEIIIPKTDTPGAIGAGVPEYINHHLRVCIALPRQKLFIAGLQKLNQISLDKFTAGFAELAQQKQIELVTTLESKTHGFTQDDKEFFIFFKSLTLFAYYTSEIGATKELAYLAVPGGYQGSFPFAKIGRAWAT
jgi:hypothetical protein